MEPFGYYKGNLFLNLILVYIIWGSTYLGVKIGLQDLQPLLLTATRFLTGGLILFTFSLFFKRRFELKEVLGSIKIGFLLTGIGTSAIAYSILFIPSGIVSVLVALLPVWIFALDFFFFSKKKPSLLSGLGMIVGVLGVMLLFNPFESNTSIPLLPVFIIFVGCLSWAYGSLISANLKQTKGIQGTAIQMLSGGLVALILSLILEKNQIGDFLNIRINSMLAMTYLIFIGSFIGYTAYVWLINNAPPLLTSTYAFVNPIVAILLGFFIAKERLEPLTTIACGVIVIAVVLMTLGRRKKKFEV